MYSSGFSRWVIKTSYNYTKSYGKFVLNKADEILTVTVPKWIETENNEIEKLNNTK